MAEPDMFDAFQAGREALRRMQESFSRYAMPHEQRQALVEGMGQLMFPSENVRALSDLIDAFGPPLAQVESLRSEIAEQREQLSKIDDRLAVMEATAERLAVAGEQIVAYQEPFMRMAAMFTGQDFGAQRTDDDTDDAGAGDDGADADVDGADVDGADVDSEPA
ncbi:MAG: hypothetical protein ACR2QO_17490 [Acidimicrobiales bacterium]